ncbi:hypothetical protein [Streptomyces sp. N35]|uniref:hypothetical protein n=1 Tax=Streptomyces sp. N35 TaxID=2795730 RepID=UPI0018F3B62F|nr:hypothetical protein [Streptomyces sp. N35]
MSAALRWITAVAGSAAAFLLVAVPWASLAPGGDDPWDVIGPVAGVVAAGALAALGWWATRADATTGGGVRRVHQSARGGGDITQTAGDHGTGAGRRRRPARENVRQKAGGKGTGTIDQTGGNRF